MEKQSSGPGFFTGLLFGGIIGVILGILFAPQHGEQSREKVRGKLDELMSMGRSAWEEGREAAGQKGSELHARFDHIRTGRD